MKRLMLVAVFGLVGLAGCGGSDEPVIVASGSDQSSVSTTSTEPTTSTTSAPTTSTTTAAPSTTSTTAQAVTTTTGSTPSTRPPTTTTTTRPAKKTITLTESPGGTFSTITVQGAGCAGPEYAVTLEIRDPSGQAFTGDGGLASPDGTWKLEEHFGPNLAAGTYTFVASCVVTNGPPVFAYAPATFNWAG